jgi:hypothetical protein
MYVVELDKTIVNVFLMEKGYRCDNSGLMGKESQEMRDGMNWRTTCLIR